MLKHAHAWTRQKLISTMTLTFFVTGCVSGVSVSALCDGTREKRSDHAAALAEDGGPRSVVTGVNLIRSLDAGCNDV